MKVSISPGTWQANWRVAALLVRICGVLAVCVGAGTSSALGQTTVAEGVARIGTVEHFAISEGSGLTASQRYPGTFWTHNDGGYQFLFAIAQTGEMQGAFQIVGANLIDWEAVAADNSGNLYLADIGGDGIERTHVAVHRVREPKPSDRYGNVEVTRSWLLRFPALKEDCESFFVHGEHGYLITRPRTNDQVTMYRYPLSSRKESTLLEEVTKINVNASVTDAGISPDGQRLGVLTSEGAHLYFINGNPASVSSPAVQSEFARFENSFMEGAAFFPGGFLVSAETRELWLFTGSNFVCSRPPVFTQGLSDLTVLLGATIQLETEVDACPLPTFSWRFNGTLLPGRTNASLSLLNVSPANVGQYVVTASNAIDVATSTANISVRTKPDLRITEVMPSEVLDATVTTADWWELTSFEPQPVDLTGWRFNDSSGDLFDPYAFPSGPVIAPGETVIFVEGLTAPEFRTWWGDTNLPPGLQIITYSGSGLSFRITGDTLLFWDNVSTDPNDTVSRANFGVADTGVTFNYDPVTGVFGAKSQLGVNGVIRAASSSDIGSPGRIEEPEPGPGGSPMAPIVGVLQVGDQVRVEFEAVAGRWYSLESRADLNTGVWAATGDTVLASVNGPMFFDKDRTGGAQFYRVRVE